MESSEAFADALLEHPKPTIAAVNGPALGGGFVLALLCDVRVAGPGAAFGFPELTRGIPASYGAARAALGRAVAADLCLTGRTVDAQEALALGVVSRIGEAAPLAEAIAALPPGGVATVKRWMAADAGDPRALLALERDAFRSAVLR